MTEVRNRLSILRNYWLKRDEESNYDKYKIAVQLNQMGTNYTLVNLTKKEQVSFRHLPVAKESEIVGNPAGAAVVSWYLLKNSGDRIGFFGDEVDSPFAGFDFKDIAQYPDRTQEILEIWRSGN